MHHSIPVGQKWSNLLPLPQDTWHSSHRCCNRPFRSQEGKETMLDIALINKLLKTCLGSSIPYSAHLYDLLMALCKWQMGSLCVGHSRWHYLSLPILTLLLLDTLLLWYWYCSSVSSCQMGKGNQMGILLQYQRCFSECTGFLFLTWLCTLNFIIWWSKTCRPWTVCAIVTALKFVQHR